MSNAPARPMVELRTVTKRFGSFVAADGVSLDIQAGEFLTLLGPSGCGKTTLLRMLAGFETPSEGSVWLDGVDVTGLPPYRRDVNQVFQSYALFPHLNVEENIAFGLKMKKTPKAELAERVRRGVELVSLGGFEKRKPSDLSGGQRQRVALARAIVCQPKVLLLDEPLSALDAQLRRQMQLELKRLQQLLGITFLFVTHDQEEALTMSDRIAVMNKGRIEQLGSASEIYHRPRTSFVASFIGQANIFSATVGAREGEWVDVQLDGRLALRVNRERVAEDARSLLLSIRPEKVHLQKQPFAAEGSENTFEASVKEEIFKGATAELTLATGSGLELAVVAANQSAHAESFRKGDRVWCRLHPSDIVVVQDT